MAANDANDHSQKKVKAGEFLEGTFNRMQCQDEKRRQNLAKLKKEIIEENCRNCSFNPKISRSSSKITARSRTPLAERVNKILLEKQHKLESIRKEKAKLEEDE